MAKPDRKTMARPRPDPATPILPSSWLLLRPSLQLIRQNIDTMLWLVILPGVVSVLGNILANGIIRRHLDTLSDTATGSEVLDVLHAIGRDLTTTSHGQLALLLAIVGIIWTLLVYPATIVFTLRAVHGLTADVFTSLRSGFHLFWRIYGVTLVVAIGTIIGLCLFIIPGLIFLSRYILAPYYLADRNLSIRQALQSSAAESKPYKGYVWGTIGVFVFYNLLGSLFNPVPYVGYLIGLGVGYLYYFGFALRYQTIRAASQASLQPPEKH